MTFEGEVRRIDLHLRSKYAYLKTTIFEISDMDYVIFCENYIGDFETLAEEFHSSIRFICVPVKLVNQIPEKYKKTINAIPDKEISKNFEGVTLRSIDFENLLLGKFSNVKFGNIFEKDRITIIEVADETEDNEIDKISDFIVNMKTGFEFKIIKKPNESNIQRTDFENHHLYIYASSTNNTNLKCVKRDEAFWYDNIDKIYAGEIGKEEIGISNSTYKCYVDFSTFKNLNLRNHLLLYNEIYISIPTHAIGEFLNEQKIKRTEFLELVKNGRLKIILNRPESAYDHNFLKEIEEINEKSIISRRGISSLVLCDLVEINKHYLLNDPIILENLPMICDFISKTYQKDSKELLNYLSWPIRALRDSLEVLHFGSEEKIGILGVNNVVLSEVNKRFEKDFTLEFLISSPHIHISNALDATYFPFFDEGFSNQGHTTIMGSALNFYKNLTKSSLENYSKAESEKKQFVFPDINAFEVNDYFSILELDKSLGDSREKIQSLMQRLSLLDPNERNMQIELYNKKVDETLNSDYDVAIELGTNFAVDLAGIIIPFLGTGIYLAKKLFSSSMNMNKLIDGIENIISSNQEKKDIHFLSKINRVARLKRKYD